MVFIRRRGRFWVAALVVLAGAALWASVGAPGPAAPTAAEEAETVTWCQIGRLRQELHLSSDDLATLACSGNQAETALPPR